MPVDNDNDNNNDNNNDNDNDIANLLIPPRNLELHAPRHGHAEPPPLQHAHHSAHHRRRHPPQLRAHLVQRQHRARQPVALHPLAHRVRPLVHPPPPHPARIVHLARRPQKRKHVAHQLLARRPPKRLVAEHPVVPAQLPDLAVLAIPHHYLPPLLQLALVHRCVRLLGEKRRKVIDTRILQYHILVVVVVVSILLLLPLQQAKKTR